MICIFSQSFFIIPYFDDIMREMRAASRPGFTGHAFGVKGSEGSKGSEGNADGSCGPEGYVRLPAAGCVERLCSLTLKGQISSCGR